MKVDRAVIVKLLESKFGRELISNLVRDWLAANPVLRVWIRAKTGMDGEALVQGTMTLIEAGTMTIQMDFTLEVWKRESGRYLGFEGDEGPIGRA